MRKIIVLFFLIFQMAFKLDAQTTYYVSLFGNNDNTSLLGAPFRDVQIGLNACAPGDTLVIYGGTYYEFLTVPVNDITIKKEWPFDDVWINAPFGVDGEGLALMLIDEKSDIHMDGITFSNHAAAAEEGVVSSIAETIPNDYSVFPNPFNDHIFINGVTERIQYSLFNTLGTEIKEGFIFGSEMINLSRFPAGLYFLRLNSSVYNIMRQ